MASSGADSTVWIVPASRVRADARCYHTDPDCPHVDLPRFREVSRESAESRRGLRECARCAGEVDRTGAGGPSDHYRALVAAAAANTESDDDQV